MDLGTGATVAGRSYVDGMAAAQPDTSKGRMRMAKGGESDQTWSFERIYDDYKTPIYNYIYHLVGNREQADDLTQDTFLKAFKALPKMDPGCTASPRTPRMMRCAAES